MKAVVAVLLLVGISSPTFANEDQCNAVEFREIIEHTESKIIKRVPLLDVIGNPYDLLSGTESACALLRFNISQDGVAEDIQPVRSEPDRLLIRAAVRALKKYEFCPSEEADNREGILVFRMRLEELDN